MTDGAYDTKWWGWGPAERQPELSPAAIELLEREVGTMEDTPPVGLEEVSLPEARPLPRSVLGILDEDLIDLQEEKRQAIEGLKHTPAAALGTCRYKLDFKKKAEKASEESA